MHAPTTSFTTTRVVTIPYLAAGEGSVLAADADGAWVGGLRPGDGRIVSDTSPSRRGGSAVPPGRRRRRGRDRRRRPLGARTHIQGEPAHPFRSSHRTRDPAAAAL
jgi:hypothetical protein